MNRIYKMLAIIFTHTVAFLVGYVLAVETEERVRKAKAEKEKEHFEQVQNAMSSVFKTDRKNYMEYVRDLDSKLHK